MANTTITDIIVIPPSLNVQAANLKASTAKQPSPFVGWWMNCQKEFYLADYPTSTIVEKATQDGLCPVCQGDLVPF